MTNTHPNHPIDPTAWNSLLRQIEKQQCVLVVGPDLISYPNDQSLFQLLCEKISESGDLKDDVDTSFKFGFEHEELLRLKPFAYFINDIIF